MNKTISEQLEEIREQICDHYCKYPEQDIPEGKQDGWLIDDPDSPCQKCPLSKL